MGPWMYIRLKNQEKPLPIYLKALVVRNDRGQYLLEKNESENY